MTDEIRLPCREEGEPDDWFIRHDGRQYAGDEYLTQEERDRISDEVMAVAAEDDILTVEEARDAADRAIDRAEEAAKTALLRRRRRARQACYDCLLRTRCLDLAIKGDERHGTWGGYYEEEIKQIRDLIEERRTRQ